MRNSPDAGAYDGQVECYEADRKEAQRGLLREESRARAENLKVSVSEVRYCEMGEFCIHALAADPPESSPGPVRLGPSHAGALCRRCSEAKYRQGDAEVLKAHRNLIRAAGVLLDRGVSGEHTIIPTLVLATLSDRDEAYARVGERLLEAHEAEKEWADLHKDFSLVFKSLTPEAPLDGVPVVRRPPVAAAWVGDYASQRVEGIRIEIHERVESRDLRRLYEEALKARKLPRDRGGGLIAWARSDESLQMLVRPNEEAALRPVFAFGTNLQAGFARPEDVAATYEGLKAQGYLAGPGGGARPKGRNVVAAVVAYYLGGRSEDPGSEEVDITKLVSGKPVTEITRLVKASLAAPRRNRSGSWRRWHDRRWQLFSQDLKPRLPSIKRVEQDFDAQDNVMNPYGRVHKTF